VSTPESGVAGASLADLCQEYWLAHLARSPIEATQLGEHRHDDRLDDLTPGATSAYSAELDEILARLRSVAAAGTSLSPEDRVTASVLAHQLETELSELACDLDAWTVDPLEGPQIAIFNMAAFQPVATTGQREALAARWEAIGAYLDQYVSNLRRGLGEGRTAVRAPVMRAIGALEQMLSRPDEGWTLLDPVREGHSAWPAAEQGAFEARLRVAVAEVVRPALTRLRDALRDEILPRARPDEHPGIMHLPGGREAYTRLIRVHTSMEGTPEELHAIGRSEVDRINAELEALGRRVLGDANRSAILARLRADPTLYFTTREEVAATAETALARASAAIPSWFGRLPRAECVVVPMGEHEEEHGTIAYYAQPAPDGTRPGRYYINTSAPRTRPRYEAEALAYHESIPGHHLQIAIAQEAGALPEFRRHLGVTAFWEGWGLYTERLADEMGLYSGDLDRIGMLSLDAWRACRLVVDTGMHAFDWSRQQAIDFMLVNTALATNNIENEVDRYIVWPGQALAYKTGQLALVRLRGDTEDRMGSRFDIRAFHDAVLGHGALPLQTLREVVEQQLGTA